MSSVYSLTVAADGGKKTFTFGGDLVINHIDKMVAEVRDALPEPADVSVVVANPSNIDMTFLQLVVAMRHSCAGAGKTFEVRAELKDDLRELVAKAGLEKELGL